MPEISSINFVADRDAGIPSSSHVKRISKDDMGSRLSLSSAQIPQKRRKIDLLSASDQLFVWTHKVLSDLPEEAVSQAVNILIDLMRDSSLSHEQKKHKVEDLLCQKIDISQFDELSSISEHAVQSLNVDENADFEDSDEEIGNEDSEKSEEEAEEYHRNDAGKSGGPLFVSLSDPVRLRDKSIVRPQDVDGHWLLNLIQGTGVGIEELLSEMEEVENLSVDERFNRLASKFKIENFPTVKLLAANTEVVLWYTKLARAELGTQREEIMEIIKTKKLDIESFLEDNMEQDIPEIIDLSITGRPIELPLRLNVKLPEGSTRFTTKEYEQYDVPATGGTGILQEIDWPLKKISDLPHFVQQCFEGINSLNVIQSKVSDFVVNTDSNMLLCAPTGAGKTNIAVLALSRCLFVNRAKAVYIAPMKALVQEQVNMLRSRFPSGVVVAELSGDEAVTRQQMKTVDVIVATPEKWDIITRKPFNTDIIRSIGLVIIDEIHILNDKTRGGGIENIVVRHKQERFPTRLLGLSATLPNYTDVAQFLEVPSSGLFYFDGRFRPIPLEQQFVGVKAVNPLKQFRTVNDVCVEKIKEQVIKGNRQALVFVHSRKETNTTRRLLVENTSLQEHEIGIHHAGLDKATRAAAEDKFRHGEHRVLICTATLAWGVNLPAAVVIIKGTQYYDPSSCGWKQLSPQDVLQMFGRAGRPGFDKRGLGIILTTQKHLGYFASVATLSLPIQSHLISRICDSLNAEITRYKVTSIDEGVSWLEKTFWYVRFSQDPAMYGDTYTLASIVHSAFTSLHRSGACSYAYPNIYPTLEGELAADFYISPDSLATYANLLKPWLSEIDLIRVFAKASEFMTMPVRVMEKAEIAFLATLVPVPIRDERHTLAAKVGILLQAYISRLPLSGLALAADMIYIAQSSSRLFRAYFEASIYLGWSSLARQAHRFYIMVQRRSWAVQTPFSQFDDCPVEIIERAEKSMLPWQRFFDLEKSDIGEVLRLGDPELASQASQYLRMFPKFSLSARCKPLTPEWLVAQITIQKDFQFSVEYHDEAEQFWLMIENQTGRLLFSRFLTLRELMKSPTVTVLAYIRLASEEFGKSYTPYLYARIISDRWLNAEYESPVSLRRLTPPALATASSLIDSDAQSSAAVRKSQKAKSKVARALETLLRSDRVAYIGLPSRSSEEQECIDIAIDYASEQNLRTLVIAPTVQEGGHLGVRFINVEEAESISRLSSRLQREFGDIDYIVCKDLHMIGHPRLGYLYELLITRLKSSLSLTRVIGFGHPATSARSIAQWLGASKSDAVNFGYDTLEQPLLIETRPCKPKMSVVHSLASVLAQIREATDTLILAPMDWQCAQIRNELKLQDLLSDKVTVRSIASVAFSTETARERWAQVIVLGTGSIDPTELFSAIGFATNRVILCSDMAEFYEWCINNALPVESSLKGQLADGFIPEVCDAGSWGPQDGVNWLSATFLYRRLRANPGFYGSEDLQEWVSETVESRFEYLNSIGAVILDSETLEIAPLALSHIVSHDGVSIEDLISPVATDLTAKSIDNQGSANKKLQNILKAKIKLNVAQNQLSELFHNIDRRQAVCQNIPLGASPLLQIPHTDSETILKCHDYGIQSIRDFIAIEDDDLRSQLLGFGNEDERMLAVADFVNKFPVVDIVNVELHDGRALVYIERDIEPDDEVSDDGWYVVVGRPDTNEIIGFKYTPAIEIPEITVQLELSSTVNPTDHITAWLMCGNYVDADKEYTVARSTS